MLNQDGFTRLAGWLNQPVAMQSGALGIMIDVLLNNPLAGAVLVNAATDADKRRTTEVLDVAEHRVRRGRIVPPRSAATTPAQKPAVNVNVPEHRVRQGRPMTPSARAKTPTTSEPEPNDAVNVSNVGGHRVRLGRPMRPAPNVPPPPSEPRHRDAADATDALGHGVRMGRLPNRMR